MKWLKDLTDHVAENRKDKEAAKTEPPWAYRSRDVEPPRGIPPEPEPPKGHGTVGFPAVPNMPQTSLTDPAIAEVIADALSGYIQDENIDELARRITLAVVVAKRVEREARKLINSEHPAMTRMSREVHRAVLEQMTAAFPQEGDKPKEPQCCGKCQDSECDDPKVPNLASMVEEARLKRDNVDRGPLDYDPATGDPVDPITGHPINPMTRRHYKKFGTKTGS